MLSLYYRIWVDAIMLAQKKTGKAGNWKLLTIIPMSMVQGINLLAIFMLIRILSHNETLALFPVHIFSTNPINTFCSVLITYFIPFMILNYLLIFSNNQYDNLMKEYKGQDGKLYLRYIYISMGIIIVPVVLKFIF
jgi:hypothetical protein